MRLETFFNKFDELADTPNGVKQLRELVMQLAVEGGLVPHSRAEPAVPYASVEDATPVNVSDVPENWRVVLLADAIKNRSGNSKLIKGKLHDEPATGRFQGFSASGADVWCDDYEHEGQAIIISAVGARCGKAFRASGKWCAIANTNITRPEPSLFDFDFAYLVLNNEHFWVRGGSAQPFVKFPPSLDRHFALPPLAEQKRIVAKVDELMALCDRLEAQQQERETRHAALAHASLARFAEAPTPANLDLLFHPSYTISPADLRKSILTLAVQGKLVPQDPNDEPAVRQLEAIQARKAELVQKQVIKKSDPSRAVDPDEVDHEIPDSWAWVRLAEICELITDGTHLTPKYTESGRMFLSAQNVKPFKFMPAKHRFVSEEHYQGYVKSRKPEKGDVLLTRVGAGIGEAATIDQDLDFAIYVSLGLVRPLRGFVFPDYITLWLNSPDGTEKSSRNTYGKGVSQGNLNLSLIRNFLVPLPPLAEQRRIVAKVEQLMALVDALEAQLAASRATAANLLEAVVAELIFRG